MSKNIVIDSTYDEVNIAILNEHNGVTDNEKPIAGIPLIPASTAADIVPE